ncbi:hypothetical protein [Variovorax sp. KBW07]|uniref:hypothetical protein n=1 Tax=Variovorax sp. KBW07 TaxID=2153358 RepID=UPI0016245EDA|nr:hypothetical protein [Variovorax sp. KBW07]
MEEAEEAEEAEEMAEMEGVKFMRKVFRVPGRGSRPFGFQLRADGHASEQVRTACVKQAASNRKRGSDETGSRAASLKARARAPENQRKTMRMGPMMTSAMERVKRPIPAATAAATAAA